ncbi:alkaline phosphatase [Curtobacterium sp. MCBD17_013]|uniref:DeoR/GlpR family DNA-binding transcription regulator n=1 Tax=unclassified Curtobacterium TaxID=257496 RepID=UPI000DA7E94F|nr:MULTISPECIES: DeoR/GlpR family DNA-binding transcription regulator [unclassified Curtobacterium]PZE76640.1 alkaline phosphatase [Curtobacterium sp. MCBD17_019]PZF66148.1 alkaline phosphatase [Curtobacterium sp. MCBD17_013]WIB64682.1 DeoR/GlpR family DNA-binding transcription regulator [Curtobacterium sp. MCBD17_040]WIB68527.1 DeoR/GlpR family DNA-binding transcription regulator [Curtobacterium sp. MCBD17_035]
MTYQGGRADPHPRATSVKRSQRMLAILERLAESGSLSLESLSAELAVSPATIRRDLADLEDQQLLRRTHGGAKTFDTAIELPVQLKDTRFREAKALIARRAAQLIPSGRYVVALSGGTTTTEVARVLATRRELTIVTNSLTTATQLASRPTLQVIMTGGLVRPHSFELVGVLAENTFNAINVGTAILGVDGITAAAGATTHDEVEARTNHAMVTHAQRTVVVADGSKVGRVTLASVATCDQVHDLVTDSTADPAALEELRDAGVRVHVADA